MKLRKRGVTLRGFTALLGVKKRQGMDANRVVCGCPLLSLACSNFLAFVDERWSLLVCVCTGCCTRFVSCYIVLGSASLRVTAGGPTPDAINLVPTPHPCFTRKDAEPVLRGVDEIAYQLPRVPGSLYRSLTNQHRRFLEQ